MSIDSIYTPNILNLFVLRFDKLLLNTQDLSIYNWNNFKQTFDNLYNHLFKSINSNNIDLFIQIYYFITLLYINYTNFLKYSKHIDFNNKNIYNYINSIKFNKKFINFLIINSNNDKINNIIKIINPFFLKRIKHRKLSNNDYINTLINEYINNSKQMDILSDSTITNDNKSTPGKKILNIIIFRFIHSKNINFINYHDFFNKVILNESKYNSSFDKFIKLIPFSKNILNSNNNNSNTNINIHFDKIINFFINKFPKLSITNIDSNNNVIKYTITNKKYNGSVIININQNNIDNLEFNCFQRNLSLINYNIKQLKNINFFNKTNNFIEINLNNPVINNISNLLHIIHLLTISFKLLETNPDDLYECIYLIDYYKYYYNTFCYFFEFIKPFINNNLSYNKFVIDLIKYIYIYSYYDYYFYYSNNLLETIINNYKFKINIFNDFLLNLKSTLRLPKDLLNYPPFFDINDDINSIIYYNFEIPNYFKLYDLINSIINSFNININSNVNILHQTISFFTQIVNKPIIKPNNNDTSDNTSDNSHNNSDSSNSSSNSDNNNSELKSKINDFDIKLSKDEKKLINNNTTYLELNVENSSNYLFNTEVNK